MDDFHPAYFETRFYAQTGSIQLDRNAVILSAYATTGQVWTKQRNKDADSELEKLLRGLDHRYLIRLIGYSPTQDHAEPSWLIDLDLQAACRIGALFEQDAIYALDRGSLMVVHCNAPHQLAYVANFQDRLDYLQPDSMRKCLESH